MAMRMDDIVNAGANAWDMYLGSGVAQMHPTSRAIGYGRGKPWQATTFTAGRRPASIVAAHR